MSDSPSLSIALTQSANQDVKSIVAYLSLELKSPKAAKTWLDNFDKTLEILCTQPEIGRIMEFTQRQDPFTVRNFLVGQYRIFYIFDSETLTVQRVMHTRRNIPKFDVLDLD